MRDTPSTAHDVRLSQVLSVGSQRRERADTVGTYHVPGPGLDELTPVSCICDWCRNGVACRPPSVSLLQRGTQGATTAHLSGTGPSANTAGERLCARCRGAWCALSALACSPALVCAPCTVRVPPSSARDGGLKGTGEEGPGAGRASRRSGPPTAGMPAASSLRSPRSRLRTVRSSRGRAGVQQPRVLVGR